jgi:hypothetical protein
MNKTDDVRFRVTPNEKIELEDKAKKCGMKMSEYARMVLLTHSVTIEITKDV